MEALRSLLTKKNAINKRSAQGIIWTKACVTNCRKVRYGILKHRKFNTAFDISKVRHDIAIYRKFDTILRNIESSIRYFELSKVRYDTSIYRKFDTIYRNIESSIWPFDISYRPFRTISNNTPRTRCGKAITLSPSEVHNRFLGDKTLGLE